MISDAALDDLKQRHDCADVAQQFGAVLRKSGQKLIGSCPLCGGGKKATRFEVTAQTWVCAVCHEGGDVVALVEKASGRDFLGAVDFLGGVRELSAEEREKIEREGRSREHKREVEAAAYREKERRVAFNIWSSNHALPAGRDGFAAAYFTGRNIDLAAVYTLRLHPLLSYFDGKDTGGSPRVVHRGPAVLAAVQGRDGRFAAVHMTWIDPARPGEKATILSETGEALPAKKVRGTKASGVIKLAGAKAPLRLFVGEGYETVLSTHTALRRLGRLRASDAFWSAVDLGNLGGPAKQAIAHPSLKHANGHALRVPGPEPDGLGWCCPDSVAELVLLGDGDSEEFLTRMALERARARYASRARAVRIVMAPAGYDFNDVLRGKDVAPDGDA